MQTVHEHLHPAADLHARDLLPPGLFADLSALLPPRRVDYIAHVLTADELRVIGDLHDALIIARIKRMSSRRLAKFDRLIPKTEKDERCYHAVQARWLYDEEYLLGTRLGRRPTSRELFLDFMRNQNGMRFRAYFALKYPERMRLRG
jgi:hypothetical protein